MPSLFSSTTYHIQNPFRSSVGKGVLAFLIFLMLITGVAQWVGQSPLSTRLPPPVIDANVPNFNVKINYLDAFVRQYGKVDCLLFGSSHVDRGLDPVVIEQVYLEQTGSQIHCFNFGLAALTVDTAGPLLRALVNKYQPRLVIFEVSARSFSVDFGDLTRPLQSDPWIRYWNGDQSLDGWVLENLFAYRYYLTVKTWQYPYNRSIMLDAWQKTSQDGFSPHSVDAFLQKIDLQGIEFHIGKSYWNGFLQALSLDGQTHLVFMESPVQESYLPYYLKGGLDAYETEFFQPVQQELSKYHISFWRGQKEVAPLLSDAMWYDSRHVNIDGSKVFSKWLGEKMAKEISPDLFR